jgi:hypothetical protein
MLHTKNYSYNEFANTVIRFLKFINTLKPN